MNTALDRATSIRRQLDERDVVDYLLCGLTALCGAAGYWILYPSVLSLIF